MFTREGQVLLERACEQVSDQVLALDGFTRAATRYSSGKPGGVQPVIELGVTWSRSRNGPMATLAPSLEAYCDEIHHLLRETLGDTPEWSSTAPIINSPFGWFGPTGVAVWSVQSSESFPVVLNEIAHYYSHYIRDSATKLDSISGYVRAASAPVDRRLVSTREDMLRSITAAILTQDFGVAEHLRDSFFTGARSRRLYADLFDQIDEGLRRSR